MSSGHEASEGGEPVATYGLDARTRTAILGVASIGAFLAIGGAAGWGARAGVSVFVGALIAVANLYGLARIVGAFLGARVEGDAGAGLWGILAVLKVVGLFGGVWLLLASHLVEPIALVVGWGALPVGLALASFFSDKTERQDAGRAKEAPPVEPPSP